MKVEVRHIKSATPCGFAAVYVVRLHDGKIKSFGGDYKAAFAFVAAAGLTPNRATKGRAS
jgi:hypothetical protein